MESQRIIDTRFARDLARDNAKLIFKETEKKRKEILAAYRVANDEYLWACEEENNDN